MLLSWLGGVELQGTYELELGGERWVRGDLWDEAGASLRARPTFDAVKIEVGADGLALTEAMIYPR